MPTGKEYRAGALENRFGTLAVNSGFVTVDQLKEGLNLQVEEDIAGKPHSFIGTILMDMGYIDKEQLAKVLLALHTE